MSREQIMFDFGAVHGQRRLPEHRVSYLAGMLSAWTLGDAKPTQAEREQFNDIARDALSRADEVRRSQ